MASTACTSNGWVMAECMGGRAGGGGGVGVGELMDRFNIGRTDMAQARRLIQSTSQPIGPRVTDPLDSIPPPPHHTIRSVGTLRRRRRPPQPPAPSASSSTARCRTAGCSTQPRASGAPAWVGMLMNREVMWRTAWVACRAYKCTCIYGGRPPMDCASSMHWPINRTATTPPAAAPQGPGLLPG